MKSSKYFLVCILILFGSLALHAQNQNDAKNPLLPEKARIISIATNISGMYYTMIDLDNNEMVIVYYGTNVDYTSIKHFELRKVIRTGITLDPDDYPALIPVAKMDKPENG